MTPVEPWDVVQEDPSLDVLVSVYVEALDIAFLMTVMRSIMFVQEELGGVAIVVTECGNTYLWDNPRGIT